MSSRIEFRAFAGSTNKTKIVGYIMLCLGLVELALQTKRCSEWDYAKKAGTRSCWDRPNAGEGETELNRLFYRLGWTKGWYKGDLRNKRFGELASDNSPPTPRPTPRSTRFASCCLTCRHRKAKHTLLFPISGRVAGGIERKTSKMMKRDLAAARKAWLAEAKTKREKESREASDFLAYKDHDGLFADFHSCRHLFITSLERAGISPKMAQTLARHSDIRLTMNVYTHTELAEQTAAIEALPGPPAGELRVVAG